jgi:hypothetical protein
MPSFDGETDRNQLLLVQKWEKEQSLQTIPRVFERLLNLDSLKCLKGPQLFPNDEVILFD